MTNTNHNYYCLYEYYIRLTDENVCVDKIEEFIVSINNIPDNKLLRAQSLVFTLTIFEYEKNIVKIGDRVQVLGKSLNSYMYY